MTNWADNTRTRPAEDIAVKSKADGATPPPLAGPAIGESMRRAVPLVAVFLGVAALIGMGEVDRLIGASLDETRSSATLSQVQGPLSLAHLDAWSIWAGSASTASWITFSVWCDFVFLTMYASGLLYLTRRIASSDKPDSGPFVFAIALVISDALENFFILSLSDDLETLGAQSGLPVHVIVVGVLATTKWILVAFTVISILRSPAFADAAAPMWRRVRHAIYVHRLGLVMIVALAVLGLIPTGSIVFDQLPDVQRAWADDGALLTSGHALVAGILTVLAACGLWIVATSACDRSDEQTERKDASALMWTLIPIGVLVVFLIGASRRPDWFLLPTFALLVYLTVTCGLSLLWIGRRFDPLPNFAAEHRAAARLLGNLLPILLLGVALLGLVRSFVGPTALVIAGDETLAVRGDVIVSSLVLASVGLIVVPLAAAVLVGLGARNDASSSSRTHRVVSAITGPVGMIAASVCALALLVGFIAAPLWFAGLFGVVGTAIVGLGAWAILIGAVSIAIDSRHPLPLFRAMRVRNTPILSVILVVAFIGSIGGGDPSIHAIRMTDPVTPQPTVEAPTVGLTGSAYLDRAIAEWETRQQDGCQFPLAGGDGDGNATVEPRDARLMILVAAEGGGIRAAYWTAHAMRTLASDPCLGTEVILSSGVSGGSVGVVAARVLADADADDFASKMENLAQSDSLAVAVGGALISDLVTGVLGFRVNPDDRAGLTERAWEVAIPELARAVDPHSNSPTGALVLNSTDATTGCRVLVLPGVTSVQAKPTVAPVTPDREDLTGTYRPLPEPTSGGFTTEPARLLQEQCRHPRNGASTGVGLDVLTSRACASNLAWSTAAMISARFTYVSPAGRLPAAGACASSVPVQLIDGGYAENTGLQQLADITPRLTAYIARNNALVDSEPDRAYIVPILLSIRNSPGQDAAAATTAAVPEILVPFAGSGAIGVQASADAWMQRVLADLDGVCATDGEPMPSCLAVQEFFRENMRSGAVIVAPGPAPAIQPPLGWRLSKMSMDSLCTALRQQSVVELPLSVPDPSPPPPPDDGPPTGPDGAPLLPPTPPPTGIPWPGFEDYADSLQSLFYLALMRSDPDHDGTPGPSSTDAGPTVSC